MIEHFDLLPCPFCGSPAAMSVLEDDDPADNEIICAWVSCSCGINMHERRTEAEAAMQWNCREANSDGSLIANQNDLRGSQPETVAREPVGWRWKGNQLVSADGKRTLLRDVVFWNITDAEKHLIERALTSPPPASAVREALEGIQTIAECALVGPKRDQTGNLESIATMCRHALSIKGTET